MHTPFESQNMVTTKEFIKASILSWLIEEDRAVFGSLWKKTCPYCKAGVLHSGCFWGKLELPAEFEVPKDFSLRFSLCCSNKACRRRTTPVSLRFPPKGKYSTAILLLVRLMLLPNSEKPKREIARIFSVSPATIRRWIKRFYAFCEIESKWRIEIKARFQLQKAGFHELWEYLGIIAKDRITQFMLLIRQCHSLWKEWNCRHKIHPQSMALLKF